eukprot:11727474-Prorocentrum_lima.AAC.1
MTSSLVGSEMCIRDSPNGAWLDNPRFQQNLRREKSGRPWFCRWVRSGRPVSYTHLTLPTICSV